MRRISIALLGLGLAAALLGCATKPLHGAVTPLGNDQHKSFVKAGDEAGAMKMFDEDARATCKKPSKLGKLDPLAEDGKYVVVSQQTSRNKAPEAKTDNKIADAAITLSVLGKALRMEASVETVTVFRCV
ncbi:MAG: hypothetical protein RL456_460 [Pseudomonadota bacterium]